MVDLSIHAELESNLRRIHRELFGPRQAGYIFFFFVKQGSTHERFDG